MPDQHFVLLGAAFASNLLLDHLLGVCPALAGSRKLEVAFGMAAATVLVLPFAAGVSAALMHWLLIPLGAAYLHLVTLVVVIYVTVRSVGAWLRARRPRRYVQIGVFLPLMSANCAVLGTGLLAVQETRGVLEAVLYGLGSGIGFGVVLLLFAALRERLAAADVPLPFRGAPIALVTLGLLSLAFSGLAGVFGS